ESFPLVINSIPAPRLCSRIDIHEFRSQTIWISYKDVDFEKAYPGVSDLGFDGVIIYDGTDDRHWYRASTIFGKRAVETTKPMSDRGWQYGHKPTKTNCDCYLHNDNGDNGKFFR